MKKNFWQDSQSKKAKNVGMTIENSWVTTIKGFAPSAVESLPSNKALKNIFHKKF